MIGAETPIGGAWLSAVWAQGKDKGFQGDWNEGCFWFDPFGRANYMFVWPKPSLPDTTKSELHYNVVRFG